MDGRATLRDDRVVHLEAGAAIRAAHAAGDGERVAALFQDAALEVWFSVPPHELRAIVAAVPPDPERTNAGLSVLAGLLDVPGHELPRRARRRAGGDPSGGALNHLLLRMRGAPRSALRTAVTTPDGGRRTGSSLFDTTGGLEAVGAVQLGITQMLAGDLGPALASFTRARLNPPAALPLLERDAYVKSALLHALFGDAGLARVHLDVAGGIGRTDSWVEPGIDVHAELAQILLLPPGDPDAFARIEAVRLGQVGELWPYYVLTLHEVHLRAGQLANGASRLMPLRAAAPPAEPGEGFPSSVFDVALAEHAALLGDVAGARALLAGADPELITTRLAAALVDQISGDYPRVVQQVLEVQEATSGLRRLDVRRLALLACALIRSDDVAACVDTLAQLRGRYPELAPHELLDLPPVLHPLLDERFPGWVPSIKARQNDYPAAEAVLTTREREVLRCLAEGLTRTQAAAALAVSVNTIKTHQRALFRKLGVSTRAEALVKAARRGLI